MAVGPSGQRHHSRKYGARMPRAHVPGVRKKKKEKKRKKEKKNKTPNKKLKQNKRKHGSKTNP
jgi:hypothetical protein